MKGKSRRKRSIVLLSGGLDSLVSFKRAYDCTTIALTLSFDYGQRSASQELRAARACAEAFGLPFRSLRLPWFQQVGHSALLDRSRRIPLLSQQDLSSPTRARQSGVEVWVPNRNMVFISIAASFAEGLRADLIVTGFNAEEARTFPDNSAEFVRRINRVLQSSTLTHPQVVSFTQTLTKREIVCLGVRIEVPFQYLYSCYLGGARMCGRCESCQRVRRAFVEAGEWKRVAGRFVRGGRVAPP